MDVAYFPDFCRVSVFRLNVGLLGQKCQFVARFCKHNHWLNFSKKTPTSRVDNPTGHDELCFLVKIKKN